MTAPWVENPDRTWTDSKSTCRYCVPMSRVGALHQELEARQQHIFLSMILDSLQNAFDSWLTRPYINPNQYQYLMKFISTFLRSYLRKLEPRSSRKTRTPVGKIYFPKISRYFLSNIYNVLRHGLKGDQPQPYVIPVLRRADQGNPSLFGGVLLVEFWRCRDLLVSYLSIFQSQWRHTCF